MTDLLLGALVAAICGLIYVGRQLRWEARGAWIATQSLHETIRHYQVVMEAFDDRLRRLENMVD